MLQKNPESKTVRNQQQRHNDSRNEVSCSIASNPTAIPGEYFWAGYASTGFTICPRDKTVINSLAQFLPPKGKLADTFKRDVVEALQTNVAVKPRVRGNRFLRRGAAASPQK